ncbi:symplekin-like [Homarus americanus]|uniref:symplekin-like n=1 Tax=Homarus americanus TaxID=6706 RepID=UPI001C45C208|nr:symplekin-like [Homarus americanus]
MLSGSMSSKECEELEDFIVEDPHNCSDLLFSWLYSEYSSDHDFSQINNIFTKALTAGNKKEKSYSDIVNSIVLKVLAKDPTKERDEFLSRLFLECPHVPEDLITSLVRVGSQGAESILVIANILRDTAQWRPLSAKPALKTLSLLATHDHESVRDQVTPILLELCDQESLRDIVTEAAVKYLKYLYLEVPPESLCTHNLGRPHQPSEWTETTVKACLYLYLALLPLNQSLIHE